MNAVPALVAGGGGGGSIANFSSPSTTASVSTVDVTLTNPAVTLLGGLSNAGLSGSSGRITGWHYGTQAATTNNWNIAAGGGGVGASGGAAGLTWVSASWTGINPTTMPTAGGNNGSGSSGGGNGGNGAVGSVVSGGTGGGGGGYAGGGGGGWVGATASTSYGYMAGGGGGGSSYISTSLVTGGSAATRTTVGVTRGLVTIQMVC